MEGLWPWTPPCLHPQVLLPGLTSLESSLSGPRGCGVTRQENQGEAKHGPLEGPSASIPASRSLSEMTPHPSHTH